MPTADGRAPQALLAGFWEYARIVLAPPRLERLQEACRGAGPGVVPGRLPAAGVSPEAFCAVIRSAAHSEGKHFVRRAGFYTGSSVARAYVQAAAHPAASAGRLAQAMSGAVPGSVLSGHATESGTFEVRVESARPLDPSFVEYAAGFAKGAGVRLNEGAPPGFRTRLEGGGRAWTGTVDFAASKPAPATGARRTRRR